MEPHVVGITGTGSLIGQAIIKSIRDSTYVDAVRLIGFDYFEDTVGSFWCDSNYILPDILMPEKFSVWKNTLMDIIAKEKIRVLFIGLDFELPHFADLKDEIERRTDCFILVSSKRVVEIANDKYLTFKFLKDNHLYYPETYLPEELASANVRFPCIVKPRVGARSRDVYIVKSKPELNTVLGKVKNPVIQELVGEMDDEYTCGVICMENQPTQIIALNRSLKDGNTFRSIFSFSFPKIIYDYLEKVASALKPMGACNFQLRLDREGVPKIFEVNSRHSGTTYIRSLFGFKEIEYILDCLLKGQTSKFNLKEGTVVRYFEEFMVDNKVG